MCLIYRLVYLQAQDPKGINSTSSKLCKNALLNSPISKTPLFGQNKHFLVMSFLRYRHSSQERRLWQAMPTPQTSPWGGQKVPWVQNFLLNFLPIILTLVYHTGNSPCILYKFIYSDPLTLRTSTTPSKVFPSIIMLHLNCSQNIPLSNKNSNNTIPLRELTLNSTCTQKFTFFTTFPLKSHILL